MNKFFAGSLALSVVVLASASLSGCAPGVQKTAAYPQGVRTLKAPAALPNNFPLAQYPGAKVLLFKKGRGAENATMTTGDAMAKVEKFYLDDLKNSGWTVDEASDEANTNDSHILTAIKGNKQAAVGIFTDTGANTSISINVKATRKKK